jgi:hypothetical protein
VQAEWLGERVATVDVDRAISNVILSKEDAGWGPNAVFRCFCHLVIFRPTILIATSQAEKVGWYPYSIRNCRDIQEALAREWPRCMGHLLHLVLTVVFDSPVPLMLYRLLSTSTD